MHYYAATESPRILALLATLPRLAITSRYIFAALTIDSQNHPASSVSAWCYLPTSHRPSSFH